MAQNIVTVSQSDNDVTVSQTPRTTVTVTSAGIQGPQGPRGEGTAEIESLNIFTGSIQTEVDNLTAVTSSYLTELPSGILSGSEQIATEISGAFAEPSASLASSVTGNTTLISNLTSKTGSYATTGSNSFVGDQNVDGNITITGNLTANQYIVSSSVTFLTQSFSSGSTIFGDTSDDTHQFTGSVNITGSFRLNNYNLPELDGTAEQIIITDGAGNLTFDLLRTVYEQVKNVSGTTLQKGTPVHVTGSVGNENTVIAASASDASTMPATFILNETLADNEAGLGIAIGFVNGVNTSEFTEGDVVYVGESGGYTNIQPTGSNLIQNLGIVTKAAVNGSGVILGAGRTNAVPNLLNGQVFFGENNRAVSKAISEIFSEASYVYSGSFSGSFEGDGSNLTGIVTDLTPLNTFTGSIQTEVDNLTAATSSYLTEVPSGTVSGSAQITAFGFISESVDISSLNTFTGSIQTEVDNLTAATSSFATTGSNNFVGDQVITGSLTVSGSTFTHTGQAVFTGKISLDDGGQNVYIGKNAGIQDDLVFNKNIGIGQEALRLNSSGNTNVGIGYQALRQNFVGDQNIGIGYRAGYSIKGNSNIAIGYESMLSSNSVSNNTAIGKSTLLLNTAGSDNTAIGTSALFRSTGDKNTVIGVEALQEMTSGDINTAVGYEAGHYISNGANNTNSSGSVFLGANTSPSGSGETNQIVIGYNATGLGSNTVVLGNDDITTTVLKGNVRISDILTLEPTHPAPASAPSGSIISSGSGAELKPYFWNGSTWTSMI